jgi:hypothetical protein
MSDSSSGSSDDARSTPKESNTETGDIGIDDSQLPEELQPGPDNPLASPDGNVSGAADSDHDDAVPEGQEPPGEPSIG